MYRPTRIVDSHIHLITAETHKARIARLAALGGELVRAYHHRWEESLTSRNEEGPEDNPREAAATAARWVGQLDRAGISRAVFFTSSEHHDEIFRFVSCSPQRFIGYLTFDPRDERNAGLLETKVRGGVIRGLKLYPMALGFRVNAPECSRVYRVCDEYRLPVVIHFGLSINATHDLSCGNVLDLAAPALRFPAARWIIPHFGAGFLRETLLLAAQYANVFIDTSSSNDWVRYSFPALSVSELFKRTYEALGARRMIFGSDSSFFPRGYRTRILDDQLQICDGLGFSQTEIDDIFCRNIESLLGL